MIMDEQDEAIKLIGETSSRQMKAAKPGLSAWVSANAGSGKTHVLSQRVVRLLLNGTPPSAILCLTYTKAAAAEMSLRIFEILANWAQMPDDELRSTIDEIEDKPSSDVKLATARTLFASALETPGGLKIQTIHAFCESLLHRFPLEANVAGHFQVLDDDAARKLQEDARSLVLNLAASRSEDKIAVCVQMILEQAGETGLDDLIDQFISKRHALSQFIEHAESTTGLRSEIARCLEVDPSKTDDDYIIALWPAPSMPDALIESYYSAALYSKNKSPKELSKCLMDCKGTKNHSRRFELLSGGLLTQAGKPRSLKNAVSKDIMAILPELPEKLMELVEHLQNTIDLLKRKACLDVTEHALVLAKQFIDIYEGLKRQKAMLDYEDLIVKTADLFTKRDAGAWVHYKLDRGIDHILVDEAQDTSPNQWKVIQSLAGEFFTGESSRNLSRTMFAVGDEKQSIYSFQGARPERFDQERRETLKRAKNSDKAFESISLRVSFRSTAEILDMVDLVFADADSSRGLSYSDDDISHQTVRQNAPGQVELWPMLVKPQKNEMDSWLEPFDAVSEQDPITLLSHQVTSVLSSWIGKEYIVDQKTKKHRHIRAGDILVLVRKRDAFVPTLMRIIKTTTNIPIAGADRLKLTDHIAIQDLVALGRVALLREDDLSLAALLKSAFFNISEDHLFELCALRSNDQSVWTRLIEAAEKDSSWDKILQKLQHFEELAQKMSVHGFYSQILTVLGARQLFLNRLGHEVTDVLDEFMSAALEHDQNGTAGLQVFLANLERTQPEIKREQEQGVNAVRIMTVHASKGLEAPIVFLVDPGSAAFHSSHMSSIRLLNPPEHQNHLPACPLWVPNSKTENEKTTLLKSDAEQMAEEEYRRLLYVGLTRAADRLIICGYRGSRESSKPTWHMLAERGFSRSPVDHLSDVEYDLDGNLWTVQRYNKTRSLVHYKENSDIGDLVSEAILAPVALDTPVQKVEKLPRPLIPSGANAIIEGDDYATSRSSPFATNDEKASNALEYGKAIHRILQILPNNPRSMWWEQGTNYLESALPNDSKAFREKVMQNVINVMDHPQFAPIFTTVGASEISIMGSLFIKDEERIVSGRIDRLVVLEDKVLIIDYKTNFKAPTNIDEVSSAYISQLSIYRAVLQPLYVGKTIDAALLYTRVPSLIEVPGAVLDQAMEELRSK